MGAAIAVGVYGVGRMGSAHARVYEELPNVDLVGVYDADEERAAAVAADHGTTARDPDALLSAADAVSVAVPTSAHFEVASAAIDRGVDVLVEKPFTETDHQAERLIDQAEAAGVRLAVGHVERFNPAIRTLADIVPDLDVVAVDARRLGPPIDREMGTSVTLDLMVHDLDVVLSLLDRPVQDVSARGTADGRYVTASLSFADGVVGTFTASRRTQQKVRTLSITATDCKVDVDYIDRSVRIHRRSVPEYVDDDGSVRYRHESLIEQPMVENGEPLKAELRSFTDAVREGTTPEVTGEDGRRVLGLARRIDDLATATREEPADVTH